MTHAVSSGVSIKDDRCAPVLISGGVSVLLTTLIASVACAVFTPLGFIAGAIYGATYGITAVLANIALNRGIISCMKEPSNNVVIALIVAKIVSLIIGMLAAIAICLALLIPLTPLTVIGIEIGAVFLTQMVDCRCFRGNYHWGVNFADPSYDRQMPRVSVKFMKV